MNLLVKIIAGAVFMIVFASVMAFTGGWWLMVTIGVAHAEWSDAIPTIGYCTSVKIAAMLSLGPGIHRLWLHYTKLPDQ